MRLLFDQGTPGPLRRHLAGHSVDTVADRGWSDLDNGELIEKAEEDGYQVLITTDQNMRYQQNPQRPPARSRGAALHGMARYPAAG